jgi:hypothetical protein
MDDLQLQRIVDHDERTRSHFIGVLPANRQPSQMRPRASMIVNCCNASLPGRHWLALYRCTSGGLEVFDSFGMNPHFYNIVGKLPEASVITYSTRQIQPIQSNHCGLYCLYYCYMKARDYTLEDIIACFSRDLEDNDDSVVKVVTQLYGLPHEYIRL